MFANSLDPDQTEQNVKLDLDPNCLTLEKTSAEDKKAWNISEGQSFKWGDPNILKIKHL